MVSLGYRGTRLGHYPHIRLDVAQSERYGEREKGTEVMDHPAFVRLDYWNPTTVDWEVGHAGTRLVNPALYIQKLRKRGVLARAVDKDTGETVYGEGTDLL